MIRKKITFSWISLLMLCALTSPAQGQTSGSAPQETFPQYLPLISAPPPREISPISYTEYVEGASHYVVGELTNWTDAVWYDPGVTVEIKGQNEQSYRTVRTFIRCVAPKQTTPFKVVFAGLAEPAAVSHVSWSYSSSPEYPPCQAAQIVSQYSHDDFGASFVVQVSNQNPKPLYSLTIAITLYDAAGKVVGVEKDTYLDYYPPNSGGIDGPAEIINTSYRSAQFSSFLVQAEGFTSQGDTFP